METNLELTEQQINFLKDLLMHEVIDHSVYSQTSQAIARGILQKLEQ